MRVGVILGLIVFFLATQVTPIKTYAAVSIGTFDLTEPITQRASQVSFYSNGILNIIGGSKCTGCSIVDIESSNILFDGSLTSWTNVGTFSKALIWHSSAYNENFRYVVGGFLDGINGIYSKISDVYKSDSSGNVWDPVQPLPVPLALGGAVVAGDYLYYGGGVNNSNQVSDKIYGAKILADGTLEPWFIAGQFPVGTAGVSLIERSGSIYSIGGYAQTQKVYRFEIYGDGRLTSPVAQPDVPAFDRGAAVRIGNQVFVFMGGALYQAEIFPDGSVSTWTSNGVVTQMGNWCCGTMNASDSFLYILGGFSPPSSYLSNVVYAPILGTPEPTPTFSLLPTVTPTVFPTPTPTTGPDPIVFVPGMGASWNYDAIMHNQPVPNENWSLNPFVKVYDNLLDSLSSYDLHVYNYDWRKNINENVSAFENFLEELGSDKYDVIGHSMGGLIARGAAISNPDLFDKLIIAGSPHLGSASTYRLWEGADFSVLNLPERIAMELYVNANRDLFDTSVATVQSLIPSLTDVFPTYNFLKNQAGDYKNVASMTYKNTYLPQNGYENEKTIFGSGFDTLSEYTYVTRDAVDLLLGKWVDGKPAANIFAPGDDTVTVLSSQVNASLYFHSDSKHSNLLDGENIDVVLETLGISDTFFGDVDPGQDSALVVSIASPATFVVTGPGGQNYSPEDNLLVIYEPTVGDYKIKLTSTAAGNYSLIIGKLTDTDSSWQEIPGTFTNAGKQVEYVTKLDPNKTDLGMDPLSEARRRLDALYSKILKSDLKPAKKALLIADIKIIKSLVVSLEKNRHKPKYKEIAVALLKTIQVSIKAFPTFAPDLRLIQDNIEEEIQNQI